MSGLLSENDPNQHILSYLEYYCDPANVLDFAVMLRGPWGVGKTYLVNKFIEQRKVDARSSKTLYVTLYGVTSYQQIDDQLFRQMHPVLASKGAKLAAQLAKGLIKGALKVDLDHTDSVSVDAKLPEIDLRDYVVSPHECTIIFDDLERCPLTTSEVLGYVNAFVEHESCKVIVVANEDEILKRIDDRYSEIKEKLIGQTLEVRSTTSVAINNFVSAVRSVRVREFLNDHIPLILSIHSESKLNNLRILKQSLWDFERFAVCLSDTHWNNDHVKRALLGLVLAVSSEVRAGRLLKQELAELAVNKIVRSMTDKEDQTKASAIEARYPDVDFDQRPISVAVIGDLLFEGWVDPGSLRRELDASPFFARAEDIPAWNRVCMLWRNNDQEMDVAVAELTAQFAQRKFDDIGQLFLIFGLYLLLSNVGLISWSRREVVRQSKKYLRDLERENRLKTAPDGNSTLDHFPGWGGFAYVETGTDEFAELEAYLKVIVNRVYRRTIPGRAAELLNLLSEDPMAFARQICLNNVTQAFYWNTPILASIAATSFLDTLLKAEPSGVSTVFASLKTRYEAGALNGNLAIERAWLIRLRSDIERRTREMPPLSKYRLLSSFRTYVEPFLTPATS